MDGWMDGYIDRYIDKLYLYMLTPSGEADFHEGCERGQQGERGEEIQYWITFSNRTCTAFAALSNIPEVISNWFRPDH